MKTVVIADEKFKGKFEGLLGANGFEFIAATTQSQLIDAALQSARAGKQMVIVQLNLAQLAITKLENLRPYFGTFGVPNLLVDTPVQSLIVCSDRAELASGAAKLRNL